MIVKPRVTCTVTIAANMITAVVTIINITKSNIKYDIYATSCYKLLELETKEIPVNILVYHHSMGWKNHCHDVQSLNSIDTK
jgi:hypothetical protein